MPTALRSGAIDAVAGAGDEPTGNLDSSTGLALLDLMVEVAHTAGIAFIIATHDPVASAKADAIYEISDGVLTPGQP